VTRTVPSWLFAGASIRLIPGWIFTPLIFFVMMD